MSNKIQMLEFRNPNGQCMFDIRGVFAQSLFNRLIHQPELVKKNKTFTNNKTIPCLVNESNEVVGLISGGIIGFVLQPKAYIKIIYSN